MVPSARVVLRSPGRRVDRVDKNPLYPTVHILEVVRQCRNFLLAVKKCHRIGYRSVEDNSVLQVDSRILLGRRRDEDSFDPAVVHTVEVGRMTEILHRDVDSSEFREFHTVIARNRIATVPDTDTRPSWILDQSRSRHPVDMDPFAKVEAVWVLVTRFRFP